MCGLFGWQLSAEAVEQGDVHALATILALNSDRRGDESWGVFKVDGVTPPTLLKNTGSIKKTCRIKTIVAPQVIGHTRKATTGKVSVRNAHPFHIGKVVGAHNGFVYDHEKLNKEFNRDFQVDSEHLIAHIAEGKEVSDLSGMGTVSYVNLDNPTVIFLGRGSGSDLAVFGIGPKNKPIGIVWCSIAYWGTEALEMAGYSEHFPITTNMRTLYRVEKYELFDEADFPFGYSQARVRTIYQADITETTPTGSQYSCGAGYGYRGRTQWDGYDANKGVDSKKSNMKLFPKSTSVNKSDVDALPEPLKKNQEECELAKGKNTEIAPADIQCMACGDWGRAVTSYEENADGIVHFPSVNEDLCLHCAMQWGDMTGGRITNIVVPRMHFVPLGRKEGEYTNKVVNAESVTTSQPNKE